jgi:hypothetical protein
MPLQSPAAVKIITDRRFHQTAISFSQPGKRLLFIHESLNHFASGKIMRRFSEMDSSFQQNGHRHTRFSEYQRVALTDFYSLNYQPDGSLNDKNIIAKKGKKAAADVRGRARQCLNKGSSSCRYKARERQNALPDKRECRKLIRRSFPRADHQFLYIIIAQLFSKFSE